MNDSSSSSQFGIDVITISAPITGIVQKWRSIKSVRLGDKLVAITSPNNNNQTFVLSSCAGKIVKILVQEKENVDIGMPMIVIQKCQHHTVLSKLCVSCGEKVESKEIKNESNSSSSQNSSQNNTALSVNGRQLHLSAQEAKRVQESKVSVLRSMKKLALVLDLDHTLLHATTAANNAAPTASALVGGIIHLPIEESLGPKGGFTIVRHHIVKLRPYLMEFIKQANKLAQLTIYTAGTRKYAEAVARILDPDRKYFGDRIVSRSDNPNDKSLGLDKSLNKLFLGDSSMAVIMDDREDVWKGDQSSQLLVVQPFYHFKGATEVNNSGGESASSTTIITMSGDKPGCKYSPTNVNNSSQLSPAEHDDQLIRCLEILKDIHSKMFNTHSPQLISRSLLSFQSPNKMNTNQINEANPSVSNILTTMKTNILSGYCITFSCIIPRNDLHPENHKFWRLAISLGAQVSSNVCSRTTHLISVQTHTSKVLECSQRSNVWILHPDWLYYCLWCLAKVEETTFMVLSPTAGKPLPIPIRDLTPLPSDLVNEIVSGTQKRSRNNLDNDDINEEKEWKKEFRSTPREKSDNILEGNSNNNGLFYNSRLISSNDNNHLLDYNSDNINISNNISESCREDILEQLDDYEDENDFHKYKDDNDNDEEERFIDYQMNQNKFNDSDSEDENIFGDFDNAMNSR
jgi:RNA polymerase II subunit A-like phosphatase